MERIKWLVFVALTLVGSQAVALPSTMAMDRYYSDASFTTLVGHERVMTCRGIPNPIVLHGQRTSFVVRTEDSCDEGGRSHSWCYMDGRLSNCPGWICNEFFC